MTKRQKHILCSIQTSLSKQLKVKVHPEKQAGWCQGRRPWERDQGGTRLKRTQLGPRWASFTKEMSAKRKSSPKTTGNQRGK